MGKAWWLLGFIAFTCAAQGIQIDTGCSCDSVKVNANRATLLPRIPVDFDLWPGNRLCVGCNFFYGNLVGLIEVAILYAIVNAIVKSFSSSSSETNVCGEDKKQGMLGHLLFAFGSILAVLGWSYYLSVVCFWWNFLSYMMMIGLVLTGPSILAAFQYPKSGGARKQQLMRRLRVAGWLLGAVTLALFQKPSLMPSQLYRHVKISETMITPDDPSVLMLRGWFLGNVTAEAYASWTFDEKMYAIDEFIKDTIAWKSDMENYGYVGLLTTPEEVIDRQSGDCQGQAVTTASLAMSLGTEAWVQETPFHWWTHVRDNVTGAEMNLNVHGSAGLQGSVTPQSIDMSFTRWPARCQIGVDGCTDLTAYNNDEFLFVAPPHQAIAIAWTGAHIFVRQILPSLQGKEYMLVIYGLVLGILISVYAQYQQNDLTPSTGATGRFFLRIAVASPVGIVTMILMYMWIIVHYPITELHLIWCITFNLTYVSGNAFNALIGTPSAVQFRAQRKMLN